ncbi:hypothetical protein Q3C01_20820 [Bradyrhizobium sp. UFLA05-109]
MQVMIVKRQPKRRCCIPRRPHPDLDYFFDRFERTACEANDDTGSEIVDLDQFRSPRQH